WQKKPKTLRVTVDGALPPGVTAKDIVLAIIAKIGTAGGTSHAVEFAGASIRALSMEGRLTVCNMATELGARSGMVAPDDTTYTYLAGREFAPKGSQWERALASWRSLPTDEEARFDSEVTLNVAAVAPMVTWGTNPEEAGPIYSTIPDPEQELDAAKR